MPILKDFELRVTQTNQLGSGHCRTIYSLHQLRKEFSDLCLLVQLNASHEDILRECGDLLWYLTNYMLSLEIPHEEICENKGSKAAMSVQDSLQKMSQILSNAVMNNTGEKPSKKSADLCHEFTRCICVLAQNLGYSISDIITKNKEDTNKYMQEKKCVEDGAKYPFEELPGEIDVLFHKGEHDAKVRMFVLTNSGEAIQIGDPLTDNSHEPDDYSFHDIFHFAFLVYLNWSPVLRALLKRKRKSQPKVDEVEDGARAAIFEEAISAVVFNRKEENRLFIKGKSGEEWIHYEVLDFIKTATSGLEVHSVSLEKWALAISMACKVFDELVKEGSGIVSVNRINKTLEVQDMSRWMKDHADGFSRILQAKDQAS